MNAVIYARYSSDNQREESIDAQVRAIREYAERNQMNIVKIYADEAKTATTDQRPEFLAMMDDAEAGHFKSVIVHKLDRFSRDRFDSAFYKRHLKKNGVQLHSVLENLDGSPESVILESVLEGMAEYFSRNLSREVMKGMMETAYQCKHTGGKPPLGFDIGPDRTYVINEIEAESVRIIYELFSSGYGYGTIVDELNAKGYKTKTGRPFAKNSVCEILRNEKYNGTFVFNRSSRKVAGKRNNHESKPDEEVIRIPGGCPAIIPMELWDKVKSKLTDNKRAPGSYGAKTVYLLSGIIYCGSCGGAMVGNKSKGGRNKDIYSYYECGTKRRLKTCSMKPVNKVFIEDHVVNALYDTLFSDEVINQVAKAIHDHIAKQDREIPKLIKALEKQIAAVESELKNIVNAIAMGMFHPSMKSKMDELESSKAILSIRLAEASFQQSSRSYSVEKIKTYLSRFREIKSMSAEEQKEAIQMFVKKVVVYDNTIDIDILTLPEPKNTKTRKFDSQKTVEFSGFAGGGEPSPPESRKNEPLNVSISIDINTYRHKS